MLLIESMLKCLWHKFHTWFFIYIHIITQVPVSAPFVSLKNRFKYEPKSYTFLRFILNYRITKVFEIIFQFIVSSSENFHLLYSKFTGSVSVCAGLISTAKQRYCSVLSAGKANAERCNVSMTATYWQLLWCWYPWANGWPTSMYKLFCLPISLT